MVKKKIVSARFSEKPSERITGEEWESLRQLSGYLGNISDSELVEIALRYTARPNMQREKYSFNRDSYLRMCQKNPSLKILTDSLESGHLEKSLSITSEGFSASIPGNTLIRYYPPYIISIESSILSRANIDISEPLMISTDSKGFRILPKA